MTPHAAFIRRADERNYRCTTCGHVATTARDIDHEDTE